MQEGGCQRRFEDFPFILDSKNGLVCCCVPVTPETEELTRSLRTYYAERAAQFGRRRGGPMVPRQKTNGLPLRIWTSVVLSHAEVLAMLILPSGEYLGRLLHQAHLFGLPLTLSAYPPGHTYPWHVHEIPTLFVLLAGRHQDENRRVTFDQSPLSVVFHPVIGPHATSVGPDGMVGLNLELTEVWLDRCGLRRRDLAIDYRLLDSLTARLLGLRLAALASAPERRPMRRWRRWLSTWSPVSCREPSPTARTPRWLPRAKEFLHAHASSPVGLRDVAAAVGVHPVYCARAFRRAVGCTVSTYLRALRLLDACQLILEERNSLADVALRVGFADQAHFTRSCSRDLGFPPGRLQRMRKQLFPAVAGSSRSGSSRSRR